MRLPNFWEHMLQRKLSFAILMVCIFAAAFAMSQKTSAPQAQTGSIVGTVTDFTNYVVPDATVVLQGPNGSDKRSVAANDNGFFSFDNIKPGVPYHINITAKGFADWASPALTITPGQYMELTGIDMKLAVAVTTVTASVSQVEIATQQVEIAEKQRVLGFIPNFYVVYDQHPVPLTPKLKFRLAIRTSIDPVTIVGAAFVAAIDQAGDTPDYGQGWKAYGQRFGANYANGLTDIFIGGLSCPRCCTRTRGTSTRAPEQRSRACSMRSPTRCERKATTGSGSRTTPA